jgi:invasion protein IalB
MDQRLPRSTALRRALAGLAALLLAAALPGMAQAQTGGTTDQPAAEQDPNTTLGEKFGDWQSVCQKVSETEQLCGNVQEVKTAEGKLALWAAFGYFQPDTGPVMILRMPYDLTDPPAGFRVANGMQLAVDGSGQVNVPVEICAPGGCQIGLLLEESFVTALKAGNKLNITIPLSTGQTATINLSLKGFTAAYDGLKKTQ